MSCTWMRRALLALAPASVLLLAACGSGDIESQLQPSRIVAFGDGFSDLGERGSRYTVNDGSINIWTHQVAASFGLSLATASAGGTSYATGNARVDSKPDAAGNSATPTIREQVDTFLAAGAVGGNDLVIVSGGLGDVVAELAQVTAGTQTGDQMVADAKQAGRDLAAQVRRLVQAGATHVVVVGPYHVGKAPLAAATGQGALLTEASSKFNEELLVSIVDLGAKVLYVDAALLYNLMVGNPTAYDLSNVTTPVCAGAAEADASLCTPATLKDPAQYNRYVFADHVHPAPQAHRKFGEYAYQRIRDRW